MTLNCPKGSKNRKEQKEGVEDKEKKRREDIMGMGGKSSQNNVI